MIEIFTTHGEWTEIPQEYVRRWLNQAVWIYHYDLIRTSSDRGEVLDLAIPAFPGAPPKFEKLLSSLNGKDCRP